jgi:hypothetical protein
MTGGARLAVGLSVLLAVASLAMTLMRQPESREPAGAADLQDQIETMRKELRRFRALQARTVPANPPSGPVAPRQPEDPAQRTDDLEPHAQVAELGHEARRAEAEERADRRVALIQATLRSEGTDIRWADQAERSILSVSENSELTGSTVGQLECRTTICRVDISHESDLAADHFSGPFLTRLPNLPRAMARRYPSEAGGRVKTVVFLAREGYRLPVLDQ